MSFASGDRSTDGLVGSRVGDFGFAQVRDATGGDLLSFNSLLFGPLNLEGEVATLVNGRATRTFNNAQLTMSLFGPATTINSQALDGLESLIDLFSQRRQLQVFLSYTQTGSGTVGSWPAVSYNYNLSRVDVSTVPTPRSLALLLAGLGALSVVRRQR
ncbi:MAG: PEP-CTERM sorting domain-containing protein [Burkholderiaceae bacterium]|jgi:hypothetical protein|nr:PEP-CTERM sorting domain-containing protein [Burkholderiaceae bacterium]